MNNNVYMHTFEDGSKMGIPISNKVEGNLFSGDSWDIWCNLTGAEMVKFYQEVDNEDVKKLIIIELDHRRKDDVWNKSYRDDFDNQWEIAYNTLIS